MDERARNSCSFLFCPETKKRNLVQRNERMLFDTHTHLNVKQFEEDEKEVIQRAKKHGVSKMAVVGFDHPTIEKSLKLSKDYEGIYPIIGWHPTEAGTYTAAVEKTLTELIKTEKVIALGEIGLDYHWMEDPKELQIESFRKQIHLAKKLALPIIVHNRDSTEDLYRVLKEEAIQDIGGIMHSFNLSPEWLEKFLALGMHISFSGVVTFKNAPKVKESAKLVPLDKLLIETDAPYLSPEPKRGQRNEPSYVRFVAKKLADLHGISFEEMADITSRNAMKLFNLKDY